MERLQLLKVTQECGLGQAFSVAMARFHIPQRSGFQSPRTGGVDPAKNQYLHNLNNPAAGLGTLHFLSATGYKPLSPGPAGQQFSAGTSLGL